jgi:streptogramin lyase
MVALLSSVLVGLSAGTAGALITVTGHITFYPLPSGDYPTAIAGTPSGDLWFLYGEAPLSRQYFGNIGKISTGGSFDGTGTLDGPNFGLNVLATDSAGNAYLTDTGYPTEVDYSTPGTVNQGSTANVYGPVAVSGTTPYWGASPIESSPPDELYSGFPTPSGILSTAANVTSLAIGALGEIDMIQGTRDYGFLYLGSVTMCDSPSTQFFPSNSDIVNLASGSAGLWFADAGRDSIWQYDGSCEGTEYPVPDGTAPRDITEGSNGNVYFTTESGVWEFVPSTGVFYKYTDPSLSDPEGITLGSDGNIWFTDGYGHQIGKLVPDVPSNPYSVLHEWVLPSGGSGSGTCVPCHWMGANSNQVPAGFGGESTIGYLYQDPGPGLVALYACSDGGQGDYLSVDPTGGCADSEVPPARLLPPTSLGIQGYIYQAAPTDGTDALSLYQCYESTSNDWLSTTIPPGPGVGNTQSCGADPPYAFDDALGDVVNSGPPAETPEIGSVPLFAVAGAAIMGAFVAVRTRGRRSAARSTI